MIEVFDFFPMKLQFLLTAGPVGKYCCLPQILDSVRASAS
jgi:hypothetical protein